MKIAYIDKNFKPDSLALIETANGIIDEYRAQGYDLTLRQLYYQMVSRDIIPNHERSYKNLGNLINDARMAGLVDWDAIEDRTRNLRGLSHWSNPRQIVQSAIYSYRIDKWTGQPYRPEVWVEKDALTGVVGPACDRLDVPYFSCRGYTSASEMWRAGRRMLSHLGGDQKPIVFHLGDHDPSGIDMTRDIIDRLELFVGRPVELRRLALNYDQVERYGPPPNPAKLSDSRASGYIEKHGRQSWELDALSPTTIGDLITGAILSVRDDDLWNERIDLEEQQRNALRDAAENIDV